MVETTNVGVAYVSILPKVGNLEKTINDAMGKAGSSAQQKFGNSFTGGIGAFGVAAGNLIASGVQKVAGVITSSIDGAISRVDTLNTFPRVMNNLGISGDAASASIKKISDGLKGLPTSLDAGASAVQRFTTVNKDIEKSTAMFLAVNDALLAGGQSMEIQSSALEQLSQMYSVGKVDAMAWRSVQQAMPAQLDQVAQSMGFTSAAIGGDLYEALKKGTVSMDDFMNEIMKLDKEGINGLASFHDAALDATKGISTSITNMHSAVKRGIGAVISAINGDTDTAVGSNISTTINNIGTAFEKTLNKLTPAAKVFGNILNYIQPIVPALAGVTIGFSGLFAAIVPVAGMMGKNPFSMMGSALKLLINPVGLVVAGIIAIGVALVALYNNSEEFRNAVNGLFSSIGQAIQPFIENLKGMMPVFQQLGQQLMQAIGNVVQALIPVIVTIVNTFTGLVPVIVPAITQIIEALIPVITTVIQTVIDVVNAIVPVISAVMPIITTVITLVASLIAVIMPVVAELISSIMPVLSVLITDIGRIITALMPVLQMIAGIISTIVSVVSAVLLPIISTIIAVLAPIIDFLVNILGGAISFVADLITAIIQILTGDFDGAINTVGGILQGFVDFWTTIWTKISDFIDRLWNGIIDIVVNAIANFSGNIKNGLNNILNWFRGLPGDIGNALGNLGSLLWNAGRDLLQGLIDGVKSMVGNVIEAVKGVANGIADTVKNILGIHSPSKVFSYFGEMSMAGYAQGIEENANMIQNAFTKAIDVSGFELSADNFKASAYVPKSRLSLDNDSNMAETHSNKKTDINLNFYNTPASPYAVYQEFKRFSTSGLAANYG